MQGVDGREATEMPYQAASSLTWALVMCRSARGLVMPSYRSARMPGR